MHRKIKIVKKITYNIYQYYYDGPLDNNNTFEVYLVLKDINADIIGLQESEGKRANDTIKILAELLNMYYVKFSIFNSAQLFGLSFLSKYPILNYDYMYLPSLDAIFSIGQYYKIHTCSLFVISDSLATLEWQAHYDPKKINKLLQNVLNLSILIIKDI